MKLSISGRSTQVKGLAALTLLLFVSVSAIRAQSTTPGPLPPDSESGPFSLRVYGSVIFNIDGDDGVTFRTGYVDEYVDLSALTIVNVAPNIELRWTTPLAVKGTSTSLNVKYRYLHFEIHDTTDVVFDWGTTFDAHLHFISLGAAIELPLPLSPTIGLDGGLCFGPLHTEHSIDGHQLSADGSLEGTRGFTRWIAGVSHVVWLVRLFAEGGMLYASEWYFPADEYSGDEQISYMKDFDRDLKAYGYELSVGLQWRIPFL